MLIPVDRRFSLAQVASHPWLSQNPETPVIVDNPQVSNLVSDAKEMLCSKKRKRGRKRSSPRCKFIIKDTTSVISSKEQKSRPSPAKKPKTITATTEPNNLVSASSKQQKQKQPSPAKKPKICVPDFIQDKSEKISDRTDVAAL